MAVPRQYKPWNAVYSVESGLRYLIEGNRSAMNILLTGATGMIGATLLPLLRGHDIWCLVRRAVPEKTLGHGKPVRSIAEITAPLDAVINLAGENIGAARWSDSRKTMLRESRVEFTSALIEQLAQSRQTPIVWINASAVGYYGDRPGQSITEDTPAGDDFAARLCADWEAAAASYPHAQRRVVLRLGVVIGRGGVVGKLSLPFKLGLGAIMGPGNQLMPWISLDDTCRIILQALGDTRYDGVFNLVAPERLHQRGFAQALARHFKRPLLMRIPAPALKLLMGEMSVLLLGDQNVRPERLAELDFEFHHPDIDSALRQLNPAQQA